MKNQKFLVPTVESQIVPIEIIQFVTFKDFDEKFVIHKDLHVPKLYVCAEYSTGSVVATGTSIKKTKDSAKEKLLLNKTIWSDVMYKQIKKIVAIGLKYPLNS